MGVFWPATLVTVVGAAACPAVHRALERALAPVGLPALTAPFCIVSGLLTALLRAIDGADGARSGAGQRVDGVAGPGGGADGRVQVVLVDSLGGVR